MVVPSHISESKTEQCLRVLKDIGSDLEMLLNDLNQRNAGYLAIKNSLNQIEEDIKDAKNRINRETVRIGVLGGRGCGKSTLANALMQVDLLPESAIVFCTSIPTNIRYNRKLVLEIDSEFDEYKYLKNESEPEIIKKVLRSVCKESENPDNEKKITRIDLGVPSMILEGKEIVDVPGFTKGNPLHQAFAERYAKSYCDVCLVLINNSESVDISSIEGLEALTNIFGKRLDSVAFIVNKCDESDENDISYIHQMVDKFLKGKDFNFYRISAKNSLQGQGEVYQFNELLGYLNFITSRKNVILTKSLLERLISNFSSLKDLCRISNTDLESLSRDMSILRDRDFGEYLGEVEKSVEIDKDKVIDKELPKLDVNSLEFPSPIGTNTGIFEYAKNLAESFSVQSTEIVTNFIQNYQATVYRRFGNIFDSKVERLNEKLENRIRQFEERFGVSHLIKPPEITNYGMMSQFNPSKIERLKPMKFRIWVEKVLPSILSRKIKFWKTPVSIQLGFISVNLTVPIIPIGVEQKYKMVSSVAENISEESIGIMNEYIFTTLDGSVREIDLTYKKAFDEFSFEWKKQIEEYLQRIELAKSTTEPLTLNKINEYVDKMKVKYNEIAPLLHQD